jgi:hypothetical protein
MFDNNPTTGGGDFNVSEYEFYKGVKKNNSFATLTGREQQAYMLLQNKVSMYGEGALNRKGWGWSSDTPTPSGGINEGESSKEPFLVNNLSEAVKRSGNNRSSFKPLAGQPGLYVTKNKLGHNNYYFTKFAEQSSAPKTPAPPFKITKPKVTYKGLGPTKIINNVNRPKPPPKVRSEYDLLFNTLDYAITYDAEMQQMAMDLVFAGDDLLDNFNYQSLDYLPDYEVEVKTELGDYDLASSVLQNKGLIPEIVKAPVDSPPISIYQPNLEVQLLNELSQAIQKAIGKGAAYGKLVKYFGNLNGEEFVGGVCQNGTLDFIYEIPEGFQNLQIDIHFDPI